MNDYYSTFQNKEFIVGGEAEKKRNKQVPSYAFGLEILNKVRESLDALVAEGSLIHREASVTAMTLTSFQTHKTNKI